MQDRQQPNMDREQHRPARVGIARHPTVGSPVWRNILRSDREAHVVLGAVGVPRSHFSRAFAWAQILSGGMDSSVCMGREDQFRFAGILGSIIYSCLFILATWRSTSLWRSEMGGPTSSLFAHKKLFHGFLCLSFLLELPFYMVLAQSRCYSKPTYSGHLLALWADLCAFSMVIMLWSRALALVKDKESLCNWVVALDCFALVYTLVIIGLVIVSRDFDDFLTGFRQPYLSLFAVHGVILLLFSMWLVLCGLKLQWRITSHPRWEPLRRARRLRIILRINGVLFLCTACFLLRVLMLGIRFFRAEVDHEDGNSMTPAQWFLLSSWIPSVIPACILLYMMRKNNQSGISQEKGGVKGIQEFEQPLVASAVSQPLSSRDSYWRHHTGGLYAPPGADGGSRRQARLSLDADELDEVEEESLGGATSKPVANHGDMRHLSIEVGQGNEIA